MSAEIKKIGQLAVIEDILTEIKDKRELLDNIEIITKDIKTELREAMNSEQDSIELPVSSWRLIDLILEILK